MSKPLNAPACDSPIQGATNNKKRQPMHNNDPDNYLNRLLRYALYPILLVAMTSYAYLELRAGADHLSCPRLTPPFDASSRLSSPSFRSAQSSGRIAPSSSRSV